MSNLSFRKANLKDLDSILKLFKSSVLAVSETHYTSAEKAAWIKVADQPSRWEAAIKNHFFILCFLEDVLLGFISLENNKHIDLIYVNPSYSRIGVAQILLEIIEVEAINKKSNQLTADSSKAAIGFFLKNGFQIKSENHNKNFGEILINYSVFKIV